MDAPRHVFLKRGDARGEVDAALARLAARGVSREASGFDKCIHVTQAEQTVLMVDGRDSPLAAEMRGAAGWMEPGDEPV
ncbi:MAG TPA: hypothetical protein VHG91_03780 [Longimicrobium sp.]|nr:hypothetical protein [Longimicrobium sp.]